MTGIKRIKRLTTSTVVSYAVLQPTVSKSRSSATTFTLLVVSFYLISTTPRAFPCVPDMEEVCSSSTSSPPRPGHFRVFQTWKKRFPVLPHLHHAANISVCSRHGRSVFQFYLISTTPRTFPCVPDMEEVCSSSTSSPPRPGHFRVFQTWKKCVPVLPHLHHAANISVCSRHGRSVFQFYLISTTAWTFPCVPDMEEVCSSSTLSPPRPGHADIRVFHTW